MTIGDTTIYEEEQNGSFLTPTKQSRRKQLTIDNLKSNITAEADMIIKNLKRKIEKKLKLKRLLKNPVMKNKKKTAARLRTSSMKRKRSTAKKGSSYNDSGKKN